MIDVVSVLQQLIRIDTTNPPGNEHQAIAYLKEMLDARGMESILVAKDPSRPNLIARLRGSGQAPGLLMQGHVDVVPTTGQTWAHDPFGAGIIDGYVWGRGALDMKSGVVMMLDAFLRLATSGRVPAGDVVLAILSDEEQGGTLGARFLVEEHADLFTGVRYGIGEFGAFPLPLAGRRFYPIQVAERTGVRFELTIRGPAGHGALLTRGSASAQLGRILTRLDQRRMPVHVVPATRLMLESMIGHVDGATKRALQALLKPRAAAATLKLLHARLGILEPVLRNTVNPTIIRGGDQHNVVPAQISVILDGRLLPGLDPEQMASELRSLVGNDAEISYLTEGTPQRAEPDMGLFPLLAAIVQERDPEGIPIPFLLPAVTDGRWFSQLGIQHYGFLPMTLPDEFQFQKVVHAADERIPADALRHGADSIHDLLERYPG